MQVIILCCSYVEDCPVSRPLSNTLNQLCLSWFRVLTYFIISIINQYYQRHPTGTRVDDGLTLIHRHHAIFLQRFKNGSKQFFTFNLKVTLDLLWFDENISLTHVCLLTTSNKDLLHM